MTAEELRQIKLEPYVPDGVTIPEGCEFRDMGECRSCRARVAWVVTAKGKRAPYNPDGISHYATCPQAATWRKK